MGFNGILLGFIRIVRDFWVDIQQDGAPSYISGFIKHYNPLLTIVVSTIKPLLRQLNAILGAPS